MGQATLQDSVIFDGLWSPWDDHHMGMSAEAIAEKRGISRQEQDECAVRSHQRALAAIDGGRFAGETVSLQARVVDGSLGQKPETRSVEFTTDEGPRRDTSPEALAKLRPAFHVNGTVTAGNSSQTSDGAAAVVVTSAARAKERGLTPMARFVTFATAGVEPERFGIGPVPAIQKALKLAGLTLDQIDLVELNEAFAAQVLACLKALPIDPDRLNVNGGAIALGHPLGCTGAKLTTTLLHELKRRNARYGMVTMCVGGGMGAAGIFERM
jgi:acetyl-CoA acyltransferase